MSQMTRIPCVKAVMTPFPYSVDESTSLTDARALMLDHGFRHLPVTRDDEIIGILSERDLRLIHELAYETRHPNNAWRVGMISTASPFIVDLNERVDTVVYSMAKRQIGSALVTRNGKLVGIVTTSDVCRLYGDLLQSLFLAPHGTDAA